MDHKQNKLENPDRLAELSPKETLMRIGLGEQDIICDIGAGSGIFTIPAARITANTVFALDINDEFLDIILAEFNYIRYTKHIGFLRRHVYDKIHVLLAALFRIPVIRF